MSTHAELCPVCHGTGKYKDYSYSNYGSNIFIENTCHGCNGKGWVTIENNKEEE